MYILTRERDGAGDSGYQSMAIFRDDDGVAQVRHDARPVVGVALQVGSLYARSYSYQDHWTTSIITEILEESENRVKFKTGNSIYIWKDI